MRDELTCPNPLCKKPNVDTVNLDIFRPTPWYVACDACGSAGPLASTEAEAIRLWKLLGHRDLARMLAVALDGLPVPCGYDGTAVCGGEGCEDADVCRATDGKIRAALDAARKAHLLPEEDTHD